ncbi:hypothetical protein GCM10009674_25490 [Nesterenkonia xinjiangensis]
MGVDVHERGEQEAARSVEQRLAFHGGQVGADFFHASADDADIGATAAAPGAVEKIPAPDELSVVHHRLPCCRRPPMCPGQHCAGIDHNPWFTENLYT